MTTILFRTNEPNLSSKLCLDTALSLYMSSDSRLIIETAGGKDFISANTIEDERFELLLTSGYAEGKLDLSAADYGLFDEYEPITNIDPEEEDNDND